MKRVMAIGVAGAMAILSYGQAPVVVPQARISGGTALQSPMTHQGTFGGSLQTGSLRGNPTVSHPIGPSGGDCRRINRSGNFVVIPNFGYYGGYYYGDSAMRDLADAEWAKVRIMEEELRIKEEQAAAELEIKKAELEAKKDQMVRQEQKSSWDRAVAMYPPLLDPKSKMRVWYEHLLKRAREMTDRWGQPVRVPELDAPDYPEIFAHRAAEQISLKPLPLAPATPVQVAETPPETPPQQPAEPRSLLPVGQEMPD